MIDLGFSVGIVEPDTPKLRCLCFEVSHTVAFAWSTGNNRPGPMPAQTPTKILFLTANPANTVPLKLDEEIRLLGQRIRRGEYRKLFDIRSVPALRATDLPYELMDGDPDIVHFSGHGSEAGELLFQRDGDSAAVPIPPSTLARVFKQLRDRIQCVVLNACYSELQAAAIAESIPCVIGMSRDVPDATAIAFAAGFYEALAFGKSVAEAFELGRIQVDLTLPADKADSEIPRLLVRPGMDANQIRFVPLSSESANAPAAGPHAAAAPFARGQRIESAREGSDGGSVRGGGSTKNSIITPQTGGPPEPPRTAPPKPLRRRPAWSALLQLDREQQYGKLLMDTIQDRASNRLVILHGQPEQNVTLFIKRVEEFLRDDAGCEVLNVPMVQNASRARSAATWGLHLKHVLGEHLGDSERPVAAMLRDASRRSPLLLALVAVDNPLKPLGVLSPEQHQGLKNFLVEALPKHLKGCRRIAVFVAIEHRGDDRSLLAELTGWAEAVWHSDQANRSHTVLPELKRPSWPEAAGYIRSYRPPLPNLAKILHEAEAAYDRLRPESTFEELARIIDDIVSLHG